MSDPTPAVPTAAIWYAPDGYDTSGKIMGRRAAGEAFLAAVANDPATNELVCLTPTPAGFKDFCDRVRGLTARTLTARRVWWGDHAVLSRVGTAYYPSPGIGDLAWHRRRRGQRGYSLCGVFHTTASAGAMDQIADLLVAPVQPWDAVICTSHAMREMVRHELDRYADYLGRRFGTRPGCPARLPVIPLGADAARFDPTTDAARAARSAWRTRLGIGPDDLCVLYFGRLSFHAKAHPLPMYLGLAAAARRVPRKVHLVQAGWFHNPGIEAAFKDGARTHAGNVTHHFVDGNDPAVRRHIWFAADLFTSLSDNIQETFGLVPIEAMAAGLPVVATDWDGYRDTVRPGVDGFLVPTWQPEPGVGAEVAEDHATGALNYDHYLMRASQATAVEVPAAADAYYRLLADPGLRARMGAAGRARAQERFDWAVVLGQYRELWAELAAARVTEPEAVPPEPGECPDPRRDDPFALYAAYPTHRLGPTTVVAPGPAAGGAVDQLLAATLTGFLIPGGDRDALARKLLELVRAGGPARVADLAVAAGADPALTTQLVGWLAKCDLVQIMNHRGTEAENTEKTEAG